MISDVLFEAIDDIRSYQADMPQVYDGLSEWINRVVAEMKALQDHLDFPPEIFGHLVRRSPAEVDSAAAGALANST